MMMVMVMNSDVESGLHEGMTSIKIKFSFRVYVRKQEYVRGLC